MVLCQQTVYVGGFRRRVMKYTKRYVAIVLAVLLVLILIPAQALIRHAANPSANDSASVAAQAQVSTGASTADSTGNPATPATSSTLTSTNSLIAYPVTARAIVQPAGTSKGAKDFSSLDQAEKAGVAAPIPQDDSYEPNTILVTLSKTDTQQDALSSVQAAIDNISGTDGTAKVQVVAGFQDGTTVARVTLPDDVSMESALLATANDQAVDFTQPNFEYTPDMSVNDPYAGWELTAVNAYNAWDQQTTSGAVTIAVIDSGVRLSQADLKDNVWADKAWDAANNMPLSQSISRGLVSNNGDSFGHGTAVAGVAAARANNGVMMAGSSYNARILPVRVGDNGFYSDAIVAASAYIIANKDALNIRVANMSFGYHTTSDAPFDNLAESYGVSQLNNAGILVVASAGNDGTNSQYINRSTGQNYPSLPSDFSTVLSVTATNASNTVDNYSDHNYYKDIAAPGSNVIVLSNGSDNGVGRVSGTSFAAPMVSGAAALLFAADESLTPAQVKKILCDTATDMGAPGYDPYYGWGLLNINAALAQVKELDTDKPVVTFDCNYPGSPAATTVSVSQGSSLGSAMPADPVRPGYFLTGWNTAANGSGSAFTSATVVNASLTVYAQWMELKPIDTSSDVISAGYMHSIVVKANGTIWDWGNNSYGQLGDGTNSFRSTPVQLTSLSGMQSASAGAYHSLGLRSDGTVWAWGYNGFGQLGDGSTSNRNAPVQVSGLTGVVAVSAGYGHSLALRSDGTVWAWGYNNYGQLGNGTTMNQTTPQQVAGLSGIVAIEAGDYHSLALRSDGTVWAWGYNYYGQLGDGSTTNRLTPVKVANLSGVIGIAANMTHSIAVRSDGTVWTWGCNSDAQLGDGTTTNRSTPVQVTGLTGAVAVSAGISHSLALKADGTVWAWGNNNYGQLGDGTTINRSTPVRVSNLSGIVSISTGYSHNLALRSDGTVWAWGSNGSNQLGDGTAINKPTPVFVIDLGGSQPAPTATVTFNYNYTGAPGVTTVTVNQGSSLGSAMPANPTRSGYNFTGWNTAANGGGSAFGSATVVSANTTVYAQWTAQKPVDISNEVISAGYTHSLAVKANGTIWSWGDNSFGQLGDGTKTSRNAPVQVTGLSGMQSVSAGAYHSLALRSDGTVWAWGYNIFGQLGDGSTGDKSAPVQVSGLTNVIAVSAGYGHSLALRSDGTVWAWGYNNYGQLGNGTTTAQSTPKQVTGLSGIVAIEAGDYHSLAIRSDGTVWAWGNNNYGQLGDGTTTNRSTPVQVTGLSGVVAVSAGTYQSFALKSDGTLFAWGNNSYAQLGDGTTTNRSTPVQLNNLTGVVSIAAGTNHSLALKSDGTVWGWGQNSFGQLGEGTTVNRATPVQVQGLRDIVAISAAYSHTLAMGSDGTVWSWGNNNYGQLGDGTMNSRLVPVQARL